VGFRRTERLARDLSPFTGIRQEDAWPVQIGDRGACGCQGSGQPVAGARADGVHAGLPHCARPVRGRLHVPHDGGRLSEAPAGRRRIDGARAALVESGCRAVRGGGRVRDSCPSSSGCCGPASWGPTARPTASVSLSNASSSFSKRSSLPYTSTAGNACAPGRISGPACAYLAAVFLSAEARTRQLVVLQAWFRQRAATSAAVVGGLAAAGIFVLRDDSRRLFDHLLGPGLPFVIVSGAAGLGALLFMPRLSSRRLRFLAVLAVASIVMGWGVAQYPYLLGTHVRIADAAAPTATLRSVLVIFGAAVVVCGPSLILLYVSRAARRAGGRVARASTRASSGSTDGSSPPPRCRRGSTAGSGSEDAGAAARARSRRT